VPLLYALKTQRREADVVFITSSEIKSQGNWGIVVWFHVTVIRATTNRENYPYLLLNIDPIDTLSAHAVLSVLGMVLS
jgi:hypothetical protein